MPGWNASFAPDSLRKFLRKHFHPAWVNPLPACKGLLLFSLILGGWTPALVFSQVLEKAQPEPLPAEILSLMSPNSAFDFFTLDALRKNPEGTREMLLQALQREDLPAGRWRLIYRLVEFGKEEEIPLLISLRQNSRDKKEEAVIEGVLRTLYDPPRLNSRLNDRLESLVLDFSFIQTRPPRRVVDANEGRWTLGEWSFSRFHRRRLPVKLIRTLRSMEGTTFARKAAIEAALSKKLGKKNWEKYRKLVMNAVEKIPRKVVLEGLARVRLFNPLNRKLLISISLHIWFGRFLGEEKTAWVLLEPKSEGEAELPVTPEGLLDRPTMRLGLRISHFNGPPIPVFQKLYLPLEP